MADTTTSTAEERPMRIASFLPSATEMIYALNLGEYVVGVSHECDYPAEAKQKTKLVDCAINLEGMSLAEIDVAVSKQLGEGKSVYLVNEEKLKEAAPTILVTQSLCEVCGPAGNEVTQVLKALKPGPQILWQTPRQFNEVFDCLIELGQATGREELARSLAAQAKERVARVAEKTAHLPNKTKVAFFEWVEPIYCGGHWVPQMLAWAGAEDMNCKDGSDSVRIEWQKVLEWEPEVIIVAPCGFKTDKASEQTKLLMAREGFANLPAAKTGRVFAVDANSYFARPGPRLVEGVELMAHLIHPELFSWEGPEDAYYRVPQPTEAPN